MATKQHTKPTAFPTNSYVLVDYIDQPLTTLHAPLEGPLRVISSNNGQYIVQNLVTDKLIEYHVSRLSYLIMIMITYLSSLRIKTHNSGLLISLLIMLVILLIEMNYFFEFDG